MSRWYDLFADLEAQAESLALLERAGEIEDRTRGEVGRVTVTDRLRAAVGSTLRVHCRGGLTLRGALTRVHQDWLLLDQEHGRETLVVAEHILAISGLSRSAAGEESQSLVDRRLALLIALRQIARDRSNVRLHLVEGAFEGTIDRAGANFVDLAVHPPGEARRRSSVLEVVLIPTASLVAVSRYA